MRCLRRLPTGWYSRVAQQLPASIEMAELAQTAMATMVGNKRTHNVGEMEEQVRGFGGGM